MDKPKPKETQGVPWADHNETESSPPDTRREEYGETDQYRNADERAVDRATDADQQEPETDGRNRDYET